MNRCPYSVAGIAWLSKVRPARVSWKLPLVFALLIFCSGSVFAQMLESFEYGVPPPGWIKTNLQGGTGWYQLPIGIAPLPGWGNGTSSVPVAVGAGTHNAYCSWDTGGSASQGYHNDQWLISPRMTGLTATSTVSYWLRFNFTNYPDEVRFRVSTNGPAPANFTIVALTNIFAKASYPNQFPPWSNHVVNVGALGIPAGTPIWIAVQEYVWDNTWNGAAVQLDVIASDLTVAPQPRVGPTSLTFTAYYEGANPAAQTFAIQSVGSSGMGYSSQPVFGAGPTNWLTLGGPPTGTLPLQQSQTFTAAVSVAGLDLGTYVATNVFNVPGATNSPIRVPITFHVIRRPQTITFPNPGPQYTTNLVGLRGTASSGQQVTFSVFSGPGNVVGATNLSFTGPGTVKVVAWQLGNVYYDVAPCVTNSLAVTKPDAGISFSDLSHVYDGSPHGATVTTVPAGLTVDTTYNGSAALPVAIGSYAVTSVVNDAIYGGIATATYTITRMVQTVAFPDPGPQWTTNRVGLAATASSGLPVAFSVASGPGSIGGGTNLTFTGAGTVSVVASQAGDADWLPAAATNSIAITKATATVALGSLSQTYDGTAKSATATTDPAGLAVDFTYDGSGTAPTAAGSYAVTGTVNEAMYQGSGVGTLTIGKGAATVVLGDLVQEYDGTAKPATATTVPAGLTVDFTCDGETNWPVAVGSYAVTGTVNEANWQGSATGTLSIVKGTAPVTLENLEQEYDGTAKSATATTVPAGLTVEFTYDGETNWPVAVGSYAVTGTVNEANWQGSAAGTLAIGKGTATIALDGLSHVYDGTEKNATTTTVPPGLTVVVTYDGETNLPVEVGYYAVTGTVNEANWQGTNVGTLVIAEIPATVTLSDLSHAYDGTAKSATATTDPAGLTVDLTYDGSATAPSNAGSYAVTGTVNEAHYQGIATGTLVIAKLPATVVLADLLHVYDGAPKSATATTVPADLTVDLTYDGSATAPSTAGSYAVTGTVNEANYEGSATGTLTIAKGAATVTLGSLTPAHDGTPKPATATTDPAGLTVDFTYDGSATAPTAAGSYAVTGTVNEANWQGSATGTLSIGKGTATVTLENLAQGYDGTPKPATATTDPAGLAVDFTYDGSVTAPTAVGSYAVTGTVNEANWQGSAAGTLTIGKGTATIALDGLSHVYDGTEKNATATTVPTGLVVALTYDGETNLPVEVGYYAVTGTVNEANWQGTNVGTLVIAEIPATVTLSDLSHAYDGTAKSATATTDPAGLTVDLTYDGSATAPSNAGSYAVTGTVNEAHYQGIATGTLVIAKLPATVVLADLLHVYDGAPKSATATTVPADLTVDLTYDGSATAPSNAGSYAVTGTVNEANYEGSATGTLTIGKGTATVTLGSLSPAHDGAPKPATATTDPAGLAVDFTYDGSVTAPTAVGSYAVTGTVNEANWQGSATGTLSIGKGTATVTLENLAQGYDGTPKPATATTLPAGLSVDFTCDGETNWPSAVGSYAVTGTVNDANWQGSATGTLMIGKGTATIALDSLSHIYDGTAKNATATTAPAGLVVDFTYDGETNLPVDMGSYAVTGTVNDANWQGAATGTLTIGKAPATVALADLLHTYDGTAKSATATTDPAGLAVDFTYDGSVTAPSNAGSYAVTGTVNDANYQGIATGMLTIAKASATAVLGNLSHVYDGAAKSATATTDPAGLTVAFTYDGSTNSPQAAGSYAVTGTVNEANWQGSSTGTLVIAKGTAAVALGSLSQTYDGAPKPATATTVPAELAVDFTYDGSVTAPSNAGSYAVTGTVNEANWQGSSAGMLTIGKGTAAVALGNLAQAYDGTPKHATATTVPAGLAVEFTYDGSTNGPVAVGSYAVTGTVNDADWIGSSTGTLAIGKGTATVVLGNLSQNYDGTARIATATTVPEGLAVAFTYDGSSTAPTAVGSYVVTGMVADATYQGSAVGTLVVGKGNQDIFDFLPPDGMQFEWGATTSLSAQASSGLTPVTFSNLTPAVASLVGSDIAFTNRGRVRVQATQAGDASWNAVSVVHEWRVGGLITNVVPGAANLGGGIEVLVQGLNLGNGTDITNVTLAGLAAAIVTQSVDDVRVIAAAAPATATGDVRVFSASFGEKVKTGAFEYRRAEQSTLVFAPVSPQTYGTTNALSISGGLGTGAVSYEVLSGPGWIVDGSNLAVTAGSGSIEVRATKAEDALNSAGSVTSTVEAAKADQVILNFQPPDGMSFPVGITTPVSAQVSSGMDVEFAVNAGPAAISNGTNLAFTGTGSVSVVATQAGDADRNPAALTNTYRIFLPPAGPPVLSRDQINVREAGEGRFYVRLDRIPAGAVTVAVSRISGDTDITATSGAALVFTALNWDAWQMVTLGAANDADAAGETATFRVVTPWYSVELAATELDDDIGENLALAAAGSTVSGSLAGRPGHLIDGIHASSANYGYTVWTNPASPGTATLDLKAATEVSRVRLLNWDWDARVHRYTIESSPDGAAWSLLVDASAGGHQGWEDWALASGPVRYLRFTGLSNSANFAVCLAEWEVYGNRAAPQALLSRAAVNARENGEGRFFVKLNQAPVANVTGSVARVSGDEDLAVKGGGALIFTPSNWDVWQMVTLGAANDADAADGAATFQVSVAGLPAQTVAATELDDDIGENLALAAAGSTVSGSLAGRPGHLIDGIHASSANYGYTVWTNPASPGTATLDLKAATEVSRVRLLNWDWDARVHRYTIESSPDGAAWSLLVDASAGGHQGWEDWALASGPVRYLRFTGLSNSANFAVCLAEWEVYGARVARRGVRAPMRDEHLGVARIPVAVVTSDDGPRHTNGWPAVDGDTNTLWAGAAGAGGWHIVLGYEPAILVDDVEVQLAEGSLTNIQFLYSTDAVDWTPLPEDLADAPVWLNYLWLLFPSDGTSAIPQVRDIRLLP